MNLIETMYFCSPEYRGAGNIYAPLIAAAVGFRGGVSGELCLGLEASLIRQFAADFLGVESSEIVEEQLSATVCELTNVACCSVVAAWLPGENFHFSVPRRLSAEEMHQELSHCFSIDGGPPRIGLEMRLA